MKTDDFKVMLAPNKLPNVSQLRYPIFVSPKLDGFRAIYIKGVFYSRSGKLIPNINLNSYFKALEGLQNIVLDGELCASGSTFSELSGALRDHYKPISIELKYNIFDALPIEQWEEKKSKLLYSERLQLVRETVNSIADRKKILDVPADLVYDSNEVIKIYKDYIKKGYEGCMLKDPVGRYKWGRATLRSAEMLRLKPKETIDVKVDSIYEGKGKYLGMAGGFSFNHAGVTCNCGSGLTDVDRSEMAKTPSKYIGKTATIEFMEETENKSLRHPIFIRWRWDK